MKINGNIVMPLERHFIVTTKRLRKATCSAQTRVKCHKRVHVWLIKLNLA